MKCCIELAKVVYQLEYQTRLWETCVKMSTMQLKLTGWFWSNHMLAQLNFPLKDKMMELRIITLA